MDYKTINRKRFYLIPDAPRYGLNKDGTLWDFDLNRQLVPYSGSYGYSTVTLMQPALGKGRPFTMHRLMAGMFLPNPKGLPEVDHKDRNTANYQLDNLQWVTSQRNKELQAKRIRADKRAAKLLKENSSSSSGIPPLSTIEANQETVNEFNTKFQSQQQANYHTTRIR
jgi:hypothetical protein